jgi:hypothetical protein
VFVVCGSVEDVAAQVVGECSDAWLLPVILLLKVSKTFTIIIGRLPAIHYADAR